MNEREARKRLLELYAEHEKLDYPGPLPSDDDSKAMEVLSCRLAPAMARKLEAIEALCEGSHSTYAAAILRILRGDEP